MLSLFRILSIALVLFPQDSWCSCWEEVFQKTLTQIQSAKTHEEFHKILHPTLYSKGVEIPPQTLPKTRKLVQSWIEHTPILESSAPAWIRVQAKVLAALESHAQKNNDALPDAAQSLKIARTILLPEYAEYVHVSKLETESIANDIKLIKDFLLGNSKIEALLKREESLEFFGRTPEIDNSFKDSLVALKDSESSKASALTLISKCESALAVLDKINKDLLQSGPNGLDLGTYQTFFEHYVWIKIQRLSLYYGSNRSADPLTKDISLTQLHFAYPGHFSLNEFYLSRMATTTLIGVLQESAGVVARYDHVIAPQDQFSVHDLGHAETGRFFFKRLSNFSDYISSLEARSLLHAEYNRLIETETDPIKKFFLEHYRWDWFHENPKFLPMHSQTLRLLKNLLQISKNAVFPLPENLAQRLRDLPSEDLERIQTNQKPEKLSPASKAFFDAIVAAHSSVVTRLLELQNSQNYRTSEQVL